MVRVSGPRIRGGPAPLPPGFPPIQARPPKFRASPAPKGEGSTKKRERLAPVPERCTKNREPLPLFQEAVTPRAESLAKKGETFLKKGEEPLNLQRRAANLRPSLRTLWRTLAGAEEGLVALRGPLLEARKGQPKGCGTLRKGGERLVKKLGRGVKFGGGGAKWEEGGLKLCVSGDALLPSALAGQIG